MCLKKTQSTSTSERQTFQRGTSTTHFDETEVSEAGTRFTTIPSQMGDKSLSMWRLPWVSEIHPLDSHVGGWPAIHATSMQGESKLHNNGPLSIHTTLRPWYWYYQWYGVYIRCRMRMSIGWNVQAEGEGLQLQNLIHSWQVYDSHSLLLVLVFQWSLIIKKQVWNHNLQNGCRTLITL